MVPTEAPILLQREAAALRAEAHGCYGQLRRDMESLAAWLEAGARTWGPMASFAIFLAFRGLEPGPDDVPLQRAEQREVRRAFAPAPFKRLFWIRRRALRMYEATRAPRREA